MVTISKAMMALAEEYIGSIETMELKKREPGKSYTKDSFEICGKTQDGRKFSLELTVEEKENADS